MHTVASKYENPTSSASQNLPSLAVLKSAFLPPIIYSHQSSPHSRRDCKRIFGNERGNGRPGFRFRIVDISYYLPRRFMKKTLSKGCRPPATSNSRVACSMVQACLPSLLTHNASCFLIFLLQSPHRMFAKSLIFMVFVFLPVLAGV